MNLGDLVRGRFRIERRVAAGGMGQIFQATDTANGAPVALKMMLDGQSDEALRFAREVEVLAELDHPGIVRYIADGITETDQPFLVMEWLPGEDLSCRLARGPLDVDQTLTLAARVADALGAAHQRGIIHRDLKPSNLFLVHGHLDEVKLLDFGIARITGAAVLTHVGTMLGTPGYMAPEQVRNEDEIGVSVDVFALGCVLMECLIGRPVFTGEHVMAVLAKILLQDPPRLRDLRPDLPSDLDTLISRMMTKDPNARLQDGAAVAAALAALNSLALVEEEAANSLPASLTGEEQRVLSLVLIAKEAPPHGEAATLSRSAALRPDDALRRAADTHGAVITPLLDGSAVVTFLDREAGRAEGSADVTAQAARCALALRAIVPDRPMALATGRAVVRGKLPVGEVIDRAASMLAQWQVKPAIAELVIDETSAHLLDGRFDVRHDQKTFTLLGMRDEGSRTLLGKPTAFVGRDAEVRLIIDHWRSCVDDSEPNVVLVLGDAGMGKSRLLHEFLHIARAATPDMEVWTGRGDALAAGSALALLGNALQNALGLQSGGSLDERHQKIKKRIATYVRTEDISRVSEFIGEIVGAPMPDTHGSPLHAARQDARLMGEQLRRAFEDFLEAETAAHPVLIVLEDLHWGDLPTIRFLEAALRHLPERPLFVLALARPEVEARFPQLWHDRAQKLRLRPLTPKACERLVGQALGDRVDPATKQRIITLADGNAFYLEELVRTAMESSLEDKLGALQLPDTVLAMVHARLETLPAESRRYLRAASIFGNAFSRNGLMALLGKIANLPALDAVLEDLVMRNFVQQRDFCRFVGDIEYDFRHALIREGVYEMLTDANRRLGHRLAGVWLEEHGESDALVLAQHFERGEELSRAASAYRRAAEHALEADDLEGAIDRAQRAIHCGAKDEEMGALRLIQAEAYNWRGELVLSEERATEAMRQLLPGTTAWFRAFQQAADVAGKLGALDRVESLAGPAIAAKPAPDALSSRTECLSICANHLCFGGRYAAADTVITALGNAADLARQRPRLVGMYHQMLSIRALTSGDPCGFRDSCAMALPFFEQAGDRRSACLIRNNLGYARAELGDYEGAEHDLRELLPIARRMNLHEVEGASLQNLGRVLMYRGLLDQGRSIQLQAIDTFAKQNHPRMKGLSHSYLADLELVAGNLSVAEREVRAAIDALADVPPLRAGALATFARVLLAQGKSGEALDAAREAFQLLESLGTIEEGETAVRLVYAEALAANGRDEEFAGAIASARQHLLVKSKRITDPAGREQFLKGIADNARTLKLALQANA